MTSPPPIRDDDVPVPQPCHIMRSATVNDGFLHADSPQQARTWSSRRRSVVAGISSRSTSRAATRRRRTPAGADVASSATRIGCSARGSSDMSVGTHVHAGLMRKV
ncbi:hypothetical protein GCM10023335_56640 [Streptomyces siamensis]|uniref:Uncharacterized protein n=1 Tax=Streptomyces siamensis TaxID=1274986 RepID=A0ABP9J825_9ACTN